MGLNTILFVTEKNKIVKWILTIDKVGFPVHPENIKDSTQKNIKKSPEEKLF